LLLAELIEAAACSGHAERATCPLAQLAEIAHVAGTDWALGIHARATAMLAEGEAVERLYREAIERLSHVKTPATLARAHLLHGEWLRREHRRVDAREQLRIAYTMLSDMGMEAFAERARRELLATGETVRKRTIETLDELTPQEVQVARLAADGQTNPEIGAQLFLSPRTVEWHLTKMFGKLGISSRKRRHHHEAMVADGRALRRLGTALMRQIRSTRVVPPQPPVPCGGRPSFSQTSEFAVGVATWRDQQVPVAGRQVCGSPSLSDRGRPLARSRGGSCEWV